MKRNKTLSVLLTVVALSAAFFLGMMYGSGRLQTSVGRVSSGAYYDDQAGVLNSRAAQAINEFNALGKGTLLVRTVKTTSPQTCYEYTDELAYELSSQGKLSETTGMILVMAIEDEDFTFLYGGALDQLDGSWEALRDDCLEPSFAEKDYSRAVIDFCNGLDRALSQKVSGPFSK